MSYSPCLCTFNLTLSKWFIKLYKVLGSTTSDGKVNFSIPRCCIKGCVCVCLNLLLHNFIWCLLRLLLKKMVNNITSMIAAELCCSFHSLLSFWLRKQSLFCTAGDLYLISSFYLPFVIPLSCFWEVDACTIHPIQDGGTTWINSDVNFFFSPPTFSLLFQVFPYFQTFYLAFEQWAFKPINYQDLFWIITVLLETIIQCIMFKLGTPIPCARLGFFCIIHTETHLQLYCLLPQSY